LFNYRALDQLPPLPIGLAYKKRKNALSATLYMKSKEKLLYKFSVRFLVIKPACVNAALCGFLGRKQRVWWGIKWKQKRETSWT